MRIEIELTDDQVAELPESITAAEFAANVARSSVEVDVRPGNAIAQESDRWVSQATIFDVVVFAE